MCLAKIQRVISLFSKTNGFDRIAKSIVPISADDKLMVVEFKVTEEMCNGHGNLHGGFTSSMVDIVNTIDLLRRGFNPGVSVDLSLMYLSSGQLNSDIVIESEILKAGKRLAFSVVHIRDKESGKLLAHGKHTKYIGN